MKATFKLLNSYFWKTIYGPIISFLFPAVLLIILGNIMRIEYIFPGIVALSMLFIGVMALPLALLELKASSLFKYIGTSPINSKKFSFVVIGYYVFIAIIAGVLLTFVTMIFFKDKVLPTGGLKYGIFSWMSSIKSLFMFYLAAIIHLALSIVAGLVIATFSKTAQQSLTISIVTIVPSMFLSGMILSVDIIASSDAMQWISRLIPFRYSTGNLVIASTPIDQTGDLLGQLSGAEKGIIFNVAKTPNPLAGMLKLDGDQLEYYDVNLNPVKISSIQDLAHWQSLIATDPDYLNDNSQIKDKTLFDLLFVNKNQDALTSSSDNLFDWTKAWGAHRVPRVEEIKGFVKAYFLGADGQGGKVDRFASIWDQIQSGNYDWLNMFFKQSNILYTIPEKILNLILPVTLSGLGLWFTAKNFKWSTR